MKATNRFSKTSYLGLINPNHTKFVDEELFDEIHRNYIKLKKVTIWYGFPGEEYKKKNEIINGQNILGIQCQYLNSINGEIKSTGINGGKMTDANLLVKELELSNGDYITKFVICFAHIISYIKFETKNNKILEVGTFNPNLSKTLKLNSEKERNMLLSFYGYYNECGLRALGCKYITRENYIWFFFMNHLRYKHYLNKNKEEEKKWTEEKIKSLNYYEQVFIRMCLLPTVLFFNIVKYY